MPHSTGLRGRELIKGHATLNDFLMLVDPSCEVAVSGADIAAVCDRHGGIGADGFVRVVRTTALPGAGAFAVSVPEAEWFMDYYNADGSVAEMCGNATRLFAHVLDSEGLRPIADGESVTIGTRGGARTVTRLGDLWTVDMGPARLTRGLPAARARWRDRGPRGCQSPGGGQHRAADRAGRRHRTGHHRLSPSRPAAISAAPGRRTDAASEKRNQPPP